MSAIINAIMEGVYKVAKILYEQAEAAKANSKFSKPIIDNIKDLEKFADQLKKNQSIGLCI